MRVLITGAGGFIASNVQHRLLTHVDVEVFSSRAAPPRRVDFDFETEGALTRLVVDLKPDAVIHAAAVSSLADCAADERLARHVNTTSTIELAAGAAEVGARFVFISTDQVFDGTAAPYGVDDPPSPIHLYGETKVAAERAVRDTPRGVILRPSLVYGPSPGGARSASESILSARARGDVPALFDDEFRTPVPVDHVAAVILRCLEQPVGGILHVGGADRMSRYDFGLEVCRAWRLPESTICRSSVADAALSIPRPADLSLDSSRVETELGLAAPAVEPSLATQAHGSQ